jgi:AcrR family transcriptional regulator
MSRQSSSEPPDLVLPGSRSALDPDRAIKPGRHGLPPETVAQIQRERLIDGFVLVVAEHGYAGVTISKVTEAAGVTKKAFYDHFATLDDCFLAAYEYGTGMLMALMSQAYQAAPSWPEGVQAALRVLLKVLAAEEPFARASVVELGAAGPGVRHARARYLESFRTFFAGQAYGLSPIHNSVVDAIVGGVYSVIYIQVEAGRTAELPELLPSLTYFVLLPLLGREEAAAYLIG